MQETPSWRPSIGAKYVIFQVHGITCGAIFTQISFISSYRQNWLAGPDGHSMCLLTLLLWFPRSFLLISLLSFPFSPLSTTLLSSVMGNAWRLPLVIAFSRMQSNVLYLLPFLILSPVFFTKKEITPTSRSTIFRDRNESSDHASVALLCFSVHRTNLVFFLFQPCGVKHTIAKDAERI